METLSKIKNKYVRSLSLKKNRDSEGCYVVEGSKMVEELIANYPERIKLIVSTDLDYTSPLFNCFSVGQEDMKQLSSLRTPPDVLAVVKIVNEAVEFNGLTLVLDGIQDPGNLGTIIRTADWFGVTTIICSPDTVDSYNPKVVQATMGSLFRVNIAYQELSSILQGSSRPIYGALLIGQNAFKTTFDEDAFLVIGNEGNGISQEIKELITHEVTIPKFGMAESLNAAMACGILLSRFRDK